jgi:hypothetical protein
VRIFAYDRFKPGVTMETSGPYLPEEVAEGIGAGRGAALRQARGHRMRNRRTHMRRLAVMTAGLAALLFPATPATAGVLDPSTPIQSCLGIATGQRASTLHDVGDHASSFDEPRQGLGNVAFRVFELDSMGEFGSVLAAIDGIDATHCP